MKIVQRGWRVAREAWLGVVAVTQIAMVLAGAFIALPLASAAAKTPEACAALQAKYPSLSGKTLVNAVNAHTPGYEALDPNDPSKYVGFDIDLPTTARPCSSPSISSSDSVKSLRFWGRVAQARAPFCVASTISNPGTAAASE